MKFLTVRIDEKMKKIEKRKKAREKRAARKPAPSMAPSAPSAEHIMAGAVRTIRAQARRAHAAELRRPRRQRP